jgi:putative phage-type endonuclease
MMEQRSEAWFQARLGKVTASRVADVIATTKSGWGASRANYAAQLVAERLTGVAADSFTNGAMQWGVDNEADARRAYAFYADATVTEDAFVDHPAIAMAGASPDGLVGEEGLVEIKCPNTATHIQTLLDGAVPGKYVTQMMFQMACTGRQWCDFASFDPRLPESMRLFVKRVHRDDDEVLRLETLIGEFLVEVEETVTRLTALYEPEQKEAA